MAESAGAQASPTFKLVLVGDGGTGKVSSFDMLVLLGGGPDKAHMSRTASGQTRESGFGFGSLF